MTFLRRLNLLYILIFITATTLFVENTKSLPITINHHLDVVPTHYDVKLISIFKRDGDKYIVMYKYPPIHRYINRAYIEEHQANASFVFYGDLNVTIDVIRPTSKISLNSSNSILPLYEEFKILNSSFFKNFNYSMEYNRNTKILSLNFGEELSRGRYRLYLKFLNAMNNTENIIIPLTVPTRGAMSNETYFQVIGARQLFPCWDDSTIKTTFNISVRHHHKYKVFSNMPIQKEEKSMKETYWKMTDTGYKMDSDIKWTYFAITPEMFTYAVTIAFLPMKFSRIETHISSISHRPELHYTSIEFAEMVINRVMDRFHDKDLYKDNIKTQFIAIPGFPFNYENWGLLVNRESDIIYNKSRHSVGHKLGVAQLIGRQMACQLFSDLINSFWSSHLWLIDGLTTLLGINALNNIEDFSTIKILNLFIVQAHYESLRLDSYFSMKLLAKKTSFSEINEFSPFFRYIKAPLVWHMIKYLITDEVFRKSIRHYFDNCAPHSMTPNDFWTIFVQQIAENKSFSEQVKQDMPSLTAMLNDLTKYRKYPVLKITRNNFISSINITIENYDILKDYYDFWIPVTYTTQNNLNFSNFKSVLHDERLIIMPSHKPFRQIYVPDNGWVIFNLRQTGYYRVNYDVENWQKITNYLNSKEFAKIHPLNRAKLIDDAFHFMIAQQIDTSIFWNLTSYLAQETSYIPWYPMIKALEHMSSIFPLSNKNVENIKVKIIKMLDGLLSKIKYEEDSKEIAFTKCLRQEAIKWACILGDSNCQRIARENLIQYISKGEVKLLPWWKEWIYCKGLMSANNRIWSLVMRKKLDHQRDNRFLEFLACSEHNTDEYLKLIRRRDNETYIGMQASNSIDSLFFIIAKHAKNNAVLRNILTNFEKLKPRNVSGLAIFTIIVNHVYTEKQLDELRNMENSIRHILINEISNRIHETKIEPNISLFEKAGVIDQAYFQERLLIKRHVENPVYRLMFYIENKLEIRLSQIKKQKDHLRNFFLEKRELVCELE